MLGNSLLAQTVRSIYKGIYKSKLKTIMIVFFYIYGIVYHHWIPEGQIIN